MRSAVEHQWLYGMKMSEREPNTSQHSRCFKEEEKTKCVEELLRTYMLAGIGPEELE